MKVWVGRRDGSSALGDWHVRARPTVSLGIYLLGKTPKWEVAIPLASEVMPTGTLWDLRRPPFILLHASKALITDFFYRSQFYQVLTAISYEKHEFKDEPRRSGDSLGRY